MAIKLFAAVRASDVAALTEAFSQDPGLREVLNHDDQTAINYAASRGDVAVVQALLPFYSNYPETLILSDAAFGGNLEIARLYLECGVDVNQVDTYGLTGLMHATMEGLRDMVLLLLEHGADLDRALARTGDTATEIAESSGHTELAHLLRQHRDKRR